MYLKTNAKDPYERVITITDTSKRLVTPKALKLKNNYKGLKHCQ